MEYTIRLYDFLSSDIHMGSRLTLIGHSGSGKTTGIKNIVRTLSPSVNGVFVQCPYADYKNKWSTKSLQEFTDNGVVDSSKNFEALTQIYHQRKAIANKLKEKVSRGELWLEEAKKQGHYVIVLDDLGFMGKKVFQNELIRELWCNARHSFITVIASLQSGRQFCPMLRGQSDYTFLYRNPVPSAQKVLHEDWVGYFSSLQQFSKVFNAVTSTAFRCMVVRNHTSGSRDIEGNVFFWGPHSVLPPREMSVEETLQTIKRELSNLVI